jgi:hypothetical protein
VRDTTAINPMMPFGARDFGGKWQFVMDNMTCGLDTNGNPIAINNERRNKGKFIADFSYATKSEYPEFAEMFLTLRQPACIVDLPTCAADPGYPAQSYNSANAPCASSSVVLVVLPIKNASGVYQVLADTITCSGIQIVHAAINGTTTLADLVVEMNSKLGALGVWAVSGLNVSLTTTACTSIGIGWQEV